MADPVVSITGGVPTSGTGTITTLGQVVAPQGASTSTGESGTSGPVRGPLIQGATLTSAPTYTTGTVNPLTTTLAGALRVDGSGATQPVSGTFWQTTQPISGTVTANQGGAPWSMKPDGTSWALTSTSANVNVTNTVPVSGTFWQATQPVSAASLPLPTGAATSANQPTNAAAASTTSGQTGNLAMGAVTTAAPSYTTATSNALSLTTAGALRVDGSAVTQPVSGTVAISGTVTANQGGTWNVTNISGTISLPTGAATSANQPSNAGQGSTTSGQTGTLSMGAVTTGNPSYTTGQTSPISLDTSGAVRVNVIAGSGGGGTSSSYGSAFPATGTAIGVKDSAGTNMTFLQVNASNALKVDGSGVTQPVSGTFWQATQPVSGTFWQATQPISAASLPLPTGAATAANQTVTQGVIGNATAPASMSVIGGVFNTTKPTLTNGQSAALQANSSGSLLVAGSAVTQPVSGTFWQAPQPVSGTVTANQGGAPWTMKPDATVWTLTGTSANVNVTNTVTVSGTVTANAQSSTAPVSTMNSASANSGLNSALACVFDDTSPTAITENNFGFARMSANRNQYMTIRDAAGNERGVNVTSGNALTVDASATTQPVSGTVTANQGGTWNITNVSGTVSLPTGAST